MSVWLLKHAVAMRKFLLSKIRRLHISRNSFSPLGLSSDTRTAFEPSFGVQSQLDKKLSVFVSPKKIHKDISRYSLYTLFSAANVASHSVACSSFLDFLLYLQAMLWLTVNGINFFLASERWSTDTFTREPGVRHIENYDNAGQKKITRIAKTNTFITAYLSFPFSEWGKLPFRIQEELFLCRL